MATEKHEKFCWIAIEMRKLDGMRVMTGHPVIYGPQQTPVPLELNKDDFLLIASPADAGPSSFLEAGACGIPSISTRVAFPIEVIRDGENGLFVNRSLDEMVAALIYVYDHGEHLRRMSDQIRLDIKNNWNYKRRSRFWDHMFEESSAP